MRVDFCLISSNKIVKRLFGERQARIVPYHIKNDEKWKGVIFTTCSFDPELKQVDLLAEFLLKRRGKVCRQILLVDVEKKDEVLSVLPAAFVAELKINKRPEASYFEKIVSTTLERMAWFEKYALEGDKRKVMLLPFKAFDHLALRNLKTACEDVTHPDFINNVMKSMSSLLALRRPRRRGKGRERCYVDDNKRGFIYGSERHARVETKTPPHLELCHLLGVSRFGFNVEADRHYNVTMESKAGETLISGDFYNCHNELTSFKKRSHLNIFCNDYMV